MEAWQGLHIIHRTFEQSLPLACPDRLSRSALWLIPSAFQILRDQIQSCLIGFLSQSRRVHSHPLVKSVHTLHAVTWRTSSHTLHLPCLHFTCSGSFIQPWRIVGIDSLKTFRQHDEGKWCHRSGETSLFGTRLILALLFPSQLNQTQF